MKRLKIFFIATALTVIAIPLPVVFAADENQVKEHHNHAHADDKEHQHKPHRDEPHHGGLVGVANDYHHELVIGDEGNVSLYVEGLPETDDALKLVTIRLMVLQGKEKEELDMALAEDDQHRFEGTLTTRLAANDKVVALIVLNDKDTRMVRFEIPVKL